MKNIIFVPSISPKVIMPRLVIFISLIFGFFVVNLFSGCKSKKIIMKPEPQKKGKINTANQEGNTVDYDEAVKRHFEMQSESTKQMMIRSDKKRKSNNAGISRTWYDELFNNSCFKNSAMVKTGHTNRSITKRQSCFLKL